MAEGDGILLDTAPDGRAADCAVGFTHVRCVPAAAGPSMLIRPDGCIAWAATRDTSIRKSAARG
jgi:uncharacterized protein